MKKLTLIISVLALVLGMSQCAKKPNQPVFGSLETSTKTITFSVNDGSGQKGDFIQIGKDLNYQWDMNNDKDVIHVYIQNGGDKFDNGEYVGTLKMVSVSSDKLSATFQSAITYEFPEEGWIRFIHYGHSVNVTDGATAETVDFASQDGTLSSISDKVIAVCDKPINKAMSYNNCMLEVQFSIIYVNLTNLEATNDVKMLNIASTGLNVSNGGVVTYNTKTKVNLGNENLSAYYLVVMPEEKTTHHTFFEDLSKEKVCCLEGKSSKGIFYLDNNNPYEVELLPNGTLPGSFSASDGNGIHFANGNLQYLGKETGTKWCFADNQWDFLGDGENGNVTLTGYSKYNSLDGDTEAARDMFGWGSNGYQDNRTDASTYQLYYQPYSTTIEPSGIGHENNYFGYGPDYYNDTQYGLTVDSNSDWGYVLGAELGWRTPTADEWMYIMKDRTTNVTGINSNAHFALVKVNGTFGMIVFPDTFTWPSGVETKPSVFDDDLDDVHWTGAVEYDMASFKMLEDEGVVFLPCGGQRSEHFEPIEIGKYGLYWSSSPYTSGDNLTENSKMAYSLGFCGDLININNYVVRYLGRTVRLVR